MVHSPFAAAFTPGTRFVDDRGRVIAIETRVIGDLKVPTGRLGAGDPFLTPFATTGVRFALRAPVGTFPVELAIGRYDTGDQLIACARVCFDRATPAVRWQIAAIETERTPDVEAASYESDTGMGSFYDLAACDRVDDAAVDAWLLATERNEAASLACHVAELGAASVAMFPSANGDGFYTSWWGFDAADRPVELATDFELLIGPVDERIELALPLPRGRIHHALLAQHELTLTAPLLTRTRATIAGRGTERIELSDGSPVEMKLLNSGERRYRWKRNAPGARLVVRVEVGVKPLDVVASDGNSIDPIDTMV